MDRSSNTRGGGAGIILEIAEGLVVELSLHFRFSATKNQEEYEAVIAGLKLAHDLGAKDVQVKTDSLMVVSQVKGEAHAKDTLL